MKAGLQGRVQLRKGLLDYTKQVQDQILQTAEETGLEAAIEGLGVARETIATTPSSLSRYPKNNRIDTGLMYASLDADVRRVGGRIIIRVGWFPKRKKYFLVQEYGGRAFGKEVAPMFALTNAYAAIEKTLRNGGIG